MKYFFLISMLCISYTTLDAMIEEGARPPSCSTPSESSSSERSIETLLRQYVLDGTITLSRERRDSAYTYTINFPPIALPLEQRNNRIPTFITLAGITVIAGGIVYSLRNHHDEEHPSVFRHLIHGIQSLWIGSTFNWHMVGDHLLSDKGAMTSLGAGTLASIGLIAALLRRPPALPLPPTDENLERLQQWYSETCSNEHRRVIESAFQTHLERAILVGNTDMAMLYLERSDSTRNELEQEEYTFSELGSARELAIALNSVSETNYTPLIEQLSIAYKTELASLSTDLERAIAQEHFGEAARLLLVNTYDKDTLEEARKIALLVGNEELAGQIDYLKTLETPLERAVYFSNPDSLIAFLNEGFTVGQLERARRLAEMLSFTAMQEQLRNAISERLTNSLEKAIYEGLAYDKEGQPHIPDHDTVMKQFETDIGRDATALMNAQKLAKELGLTDMRNYIDKQRQKVVRKSMMEERKRRQSRAPGGSSKKSERRSSKKTGSSKRGK